MTVGCARGRDSCFNLKKRFSEAMRLSELLYQTIAKAEPGFHAGVLVLKI
jgi:hypothetical protein